jgi:hypothetical protein
LKVVVKSVKVLRMHENPHPGSFGTSLLKKHSGKKAGGGGGEGIFFIDKNILPFDYVETVKT